MLHLLQPPVVQEAAELLLLHLRFLEGMEQLTPVGAVAPLIRINPQQVGQVVQVS